MHFLLAKTTRVIDQVKVVLCYRHIFTDVRMRRRDYLGKWNKTVTWFTLMGRRYPIIALSVNDTGRTLLFDYRTVCVINYTVDAHAKSSDGALFTYSFLRFRSHFLSRSRCTVVN